MKKRNRSDGLIIFGKIFSISLISNLMVLIILNINASTVNAFHKSYLDENNLKNYSKFHPSLLREIKQRNSEELIPVIIEWNRNSSILSPFHPLPNKKDQLAHRIALVATLRDETNKGTLSLFNFLRNAESIGLASNLRSFWISPVISLKTTTKLLETLSSRPEIVQIRLDERIELGVQPPVLHTDASSSIGYPLNLKMISVDMAEQVLGLDGSGVVVASLDTGVDWQHPALIKKYRGYNRYGPAIHSGNWYVATNESYLYPGDGYGHGTHTLGLIVGDDGEENRIGVAPGAKWIAVKLFTNQGYTYESWIHDAFQWILAPNGDPTLAPDIINNSWGSNNGNDDRYRTDIDVLRTAGILSVFSAGNNGPNAGSIASPASYPESLAVGAIDQDSIVASFSSRGPSIWEEIKPEIVAPGVDIRSSYPGGGYAIADGTSQAAPQVAGVAALIRQADPSLTPDQIETILQTASKPIDNIIPNANIGWGLVDAYQSGLRVTANGELRGGVYSIAGNPIPDPIITVTPRDTYSHTKAITFSGDSKGLFTFALTPGYYDVTASAFGFISQTQPMVDITTTRITHVDFYLATAPVGSIFGQVFDLESGLPLSATIEVINTPVSIQSDSNTGSYSLALPSGTWQIIYKAPAHRIGKITQTVVSGNGYLHDIALKPAPTILLVDSGRWYYDSHITYLIDALDELDYIYSIWSIRNPFGQDGLPSDLPTLQTLQNYDLLIWSAPQDSPGVLQMGTALYDYLESGGSMLISGQDVAYYDASYFSGLPSQNYLTNQLGVWWQKEGNLAYLNGISGSILDGISLLFNTPDSAMNQNHPDAATLFDPVMSNRILSWEDEGIAAISGKHCKPYKAIWLGFGFEGIGPRSARIESLDRILKWLDNPHPESYIHATDPETLIISSPGTVVTNTFTLFNLGTNVDTLRIQLDSYSWDSIIETPQGISSSSYLDLELGSCSSQPITCTINIPQNALRNDFSRLSLHISSFSDPSITATVSMTTKVPAPLLFTDDERWYNHEEKYIRALNSLAIPFDYIETRGDSTPSTTTLNRYPIVLWSTGYDWFAPLTDIDESNLSYYLDQGGRLLLSSQDLMDLRYGSAFVEDRLGVGYTNLSIKPNRAIAPQNNPLNIRPNYWHLIFPFNNWADGIIPRSGSQAIINDNQFNTIGIINANANWRTSYFSFPLETLDDRALSHLLSNTLLWLSPFGESYLNFPPAAREGSIIPITITIKSATDAILPGSRVVTILPVEISLITDSITGPAVFDTQSNSIIWNGDLIPGNPITIGAELEINPGISDGTLLNLYTLFYDSAGIVISTKDDLLIDAPYLHVEKSVFPPQANPGEIVTHTIQLYNSGPVATAVTVKETIPENLVLITDSIHTTMGNYSMIDTGFQWQGDLNSELSTSITYQTLIDIHQPGAFFYASTHIQYATTNLFLWSKLVSPAIIYLPRAGQ